MRRSAARVLAACLAGQAALAAPNAATAEADAVATGIESTADGSDGSRCTVRLERLARQDWLWGALAVRPFARAVVEGGRVTVHRPATAAPAADPGAAVAPTDADPERERMLTALHRLAEGLAGRELIEFRIHDFTFVALRGDEPQLTLEAREARIERDAASVLLRDVRGHSLLGQRLEADRVRLRWQPERLDVRGSWRLCEGAACTSGRGARLAFDVASGRLALASAAPATSMPAPGQPCERCERSER